MLLIASLYDKLADLLVDFRLQKKAVRASERDSGKRPRMSHQNVTAVRGLECGAAARPTSSVYPLGRWHVKIAAGADACAQRRPYASPQTRRVIPPILKPTSVMDG